jgi:hypothetical protein
MAPVPKPCGTYNNEMNVINCSFPWRVVIVIGPTGLAALFIKYDYAETKDLAKTFLTLASGVLVISLTFSEKVVEFRTASWPSKLSIVVAWISLILSIIFCGSALVYLSIAGGEAVYGGSFEATAHMAYGLIVLSGCAFVFGLLALVASAILSLLVRSIVRER